MYSLSLGGDSWNLNHFGRILVSFKNSRIALFVFGLAVVMPCMTPASLYAQTVSGTILGTVQDQQGAVVAKAAVSAKSTDTGVTRTATTDDSGVYRIVSIPAGAMRSA